MARRKQQQVEPGADVAVRGPRIEPIDPALWPARADPGTPPPPLDDTAWGGPRSVDHGASELPSATWSHPPAAVGDGDAPAEDRFEPDATPSPAVPAAPISRSALAASPVRRWLPIVASLAVTAAVVAAVAARGDNGGSPPGSAVAPVSTVGAGIVTVAPGANGGGVVTVGPDAGATPSSLPATPSTQPPARSSSATTSTVPGGAASSTPATTSSTSVAPTVPGRPDATPPPIATSAVAAELLVGKAGALPWWGEVVDGRIVVRGRIASDAQRRLALRNVTDKVGADGAVDELVLDPSVADAPGSGPVPLFVRAPVTFGPGSAVVQPEFNPLVGFARYTLFKQPNVRLTVVGFAEVGEPSSLALERARAVEAQVAVDPIDPLRVKVLAAPPAPGSATSIERRVEFVFFGVFDA